MSPRGAIIMVLLVLAAGGLGWTLATRGDAPTPPTGSRVAPQPAPDQAHLAVLQSTPEAGAHRERRAFEARAREFTRSASKLGPVERSEEARRLELDIDRYEGNGGLSAGEALLLRSALLKATVEDPAQQALKMADLVEHYRAQSEQLAAQHLARQRQDPRLVDYKSREQVVVREVMAMETVPGGLSRDDYLRQRLQAERERIYR